jgi:hypothetical protein
MIIVSSVHTNACLQAWIKCEDLVQELHGIRNYLCAKIVKVIDECAFICMGTFHALKSGSLNIPKMAILCVGICEECADECEKQQGEKFKSVAKFCRECSNKISDLARTSS